MTELDTTAAREDLAPKAERLRERMRLAASVALLDIEENEKQALEAIKRESGEKRGKIKKALDEAIAMTDMKIIRKFWHTDESKLFLHFVGDRTKVGNFGSAGE